MGRVQKQAFFFLLRFVCSTFLMFGLVCFLCFRKHAIEKKKSNLGYAFVNFTTPTAAFKFYSEFQGFEWDVTKNKKICEINVAQYQVFFFFFVVISQNAIFYSNICKRGSS